MKLEFHQVEIANFKSFGGGPHTLTLDRPVGLHFIRGRNEYEPRLGSNGAGKSSLFDAMSWALYGRTPDGLRNPDVKPWFGKGNPRVSVHVELDGEPCVFTRTVSPNTLSMQFDGTESEVSQERLVKMIGIDGPTFEHTLLMGQGRPLFFDLPPREKMQLFVDVLDLERWDERAEHASERHGELNHELAQAEGELIGLSDSIERTTKLWEAARKQQQEWAEQQRTKMDAADKEVAALEKQLERAQKSLDKADLAYEEAGVALKLLLPDEEDLHKKLREADRVLVQRTELKKGLAKQSDQLFEDLAQLSKDGKCPHCGQTIKGTKLEHHQAELEKELLAIVRKHDAVSLNKAKAVVVQASGALAKHKELQDAARKNTDKAGTELDTYTPVVANLKARIGQLHIAMEQSEKEENPHQEQMQKLRREKNTLLADKNELDATIAKVQKLAERTRFWVKGFRDVRLFIVEDILQELELTTNAILDEVGLQGWQVHYAAEKETKSGTVQRGLNVMILSPRNDDAVRWESWSGGEGQRLRLVGALALSEVLLNHSGVQTSMEILDEPTAHLSEEGVEDLCDFLADRAKQLERRTFYVDHQSVESARFASVLTVVKTEKGSHIEDEGSVVPVSNRPRRHLGRRKGPPTIPLRADP